MMRILEMRHVCVIKYWRDEFLHWNPADYCGVTQVFVSSDDVWLPEISVRNRSRSRPTKEFVFASVINWTLNRDLNILLVLVFNSAVNGNDISINEPQRYRISVTYNGIVRWVPLMHWVTTCKMNVYYFPFDRQICQVVFTNWMYSATLLNYSLISDTLVLDGFHNHSEWLLVDSAVSIIAASSQTFPLFYFSCLIFPPF